MGNRHRRAAKGSSSALLFMIIAAAVLAFIPLRVTLAVGSGPTSNLGIFAPAASLVPLSGTHVDIDSLGILLRTPKLPKGPSPLSFILSNLGLRSLASYLEQTGQIPLLGNATFLPILPSGAGTIGFPLNAIDYFAVKVQKFTIDIGLASGSMTGLLSPFGSGPSLASGSGETIQVRVVAVSVTITGYNATPPVDNRYGEDNVAGLNTVFLISFDRVFLDLFVDPAGNSSTYVASADMTVYQAIAMAFEGVFLG